MIRHESEHQRGRWHRRAHLLMITVAFGLLAVSCGGSDNDEASTEQLLEELEGRDLSPAEVAEREEVATLLCGLDDVVLVEIWDQLSPAELAFQDIVFGRTCPERLPLYAAETGRFVVEEDAED